MRIGRSRAAASKTRIVVVTVDGAFADSVRDTFSANPAIDLALVPGSVATIDHKEFEGATVVVVDLDSNDDRQTDALQALVAKTNGWPPVVVVTPISCWASELSDHHTLMCGLMRSRLRKARSTSSG